MGKNIFSPNKNKNPLYAESQEIFLGIDKYFSQALWPQAAPGPEAT